MGHPTKLNNITLKPLAPGIWFPKCFMHYSSDTANLPASHTQLNRVGGWIDRPAPALLGLPATSTDAVAPRDDDRLSSDDIDDDKSSSNDDGNNEHLSNDNDEPSSSRKHSPWSQEDEDFCSSGRKRKVGLGIGYFVNF